jgi:cation diffusion facilitator CzcD-associated flavoprotein CzcO
MIEVAVIGAGSAGLVTAKHLLASGLRCCVFEAAGTLGGAWSQHDNIPGAGAATSTATTCSTTPMWKGLRTNLSKHTCRFSEFPWPENTPTFPSKEDMDWYLKAYAKEFLLENESESENESDCSFLYDCRVTKISPIGIDNPSNDDENNIDSACSPDQKYRVEWTDSVAQTKHSKEFGGVVLATGFFSKPNYPSGLLPELIKRSNKNENQNLNQHSDENENNDKEIEIIHSKDYSCHEQFANENGSEDENNDPPPLQQQPKKIAIVGSSHSALEIAVDLTKSAEQPVTVIMPRIPWVVPRYVPASIRNEKCNSNNSDGFLPIDLAFYRRTHDTDAVEENTVLTPQSCRSKNEHLRALLGPRQDQILPVPPSSFDKPPMVAVSDLFLDLVADGKITVLNGRLEGLTKDGTGLRVSRSKKNNDENDSTVEEEILSGVTSLICCTGYSPDLESHFGSSATTTEEDDDLPSPSNILETINYDPGDTFSPMTTYLETLHPRLSNLAFVGMYRGPYMGVVELQARLASEHLSGKSTCSLSNEQVRKGLETSEAIRHQDPSLCPQFPRFDYVGFLDSLVGSLSPGQKLLFPRENLNAGDMVTPAFYQPDPNLVEQAKTELQSEVEKGKSGHHLPGIVTSALVGNWSFERDIVHFASGGTAIAQRQYIHGTVNYSRSKDHDDVRYREDGLFEISPTKSLPVFREYDYLCTLGDDNGIGSGSALELFFVENGKRTYLFLSLQFKHQDTDGYWVATNDHLCIKDLYTANFRIKLDGLAATEVVITYRVRGPAKDYESTTTMRPIQQ